MADEEKKESLDEARDKEVTEEAAEATEEAPAEASDAVVRPNSPKEEKAEKPKEEVKEEPKEEPKKAEKAEPTGKHADLIKQVESMTVAELADLVKALEDRFGVSAAAPMAVAAGAGATAPAAEEKSSYTVMLKEAGAQKIAVIKAVREVNQQLGLVDAKNLVESAPKEVIKDAPKEDAEAAKKKLEEAGATVELV